MNMKIVAIGLIGMVVGGGVFYAKQQGEAKVNLEVFNQIKQFEKKFVDEKGVQNGTISILQENVNCSVGTTVECVIKDIVIDNSLSKTTINSITVTNVEALKDFNDAKELFENNNTLDVDAEVSVEIQGLTLEDKTNETKIKILHFDKFNIEADMDVTNNIARHIIGNIKVSGVSVDQNGKTQSISDSEIGINITKKESSILFSNGDFLVSIETKDDLSNLNQLENSQEQLVKMDNSKISISLKRPFADMQKSVLDLLKYNGLSPMLIGSIEQQTDMFNQTIKGKDFISNSRDGFPQYIAMAKQMQLTVKNGNEDLERILSYVIGKNDTVQVIMENHIIEVK